MAASEPAVWKVRFFTIWIGQAFSMVGSALVRFALIWWLTEETGSATVLATASLVSMLPFILLGPFVGALVDRWNRRWTMIISDALIALLTGLLAYLFLRGVARTWHIYAVLFARSLGGAFQDPAMRASTSLLAPREQLSRIGGMNETLAGVVNIVSPPLGALLLEVLDMQGTLAVDILTALLAIGPLFFLRIPQPAPRDRVDGATSVLHDMVAGFRYVLSWRGLTFMFIALAGLRFFLAPSFSFLPLVVTEHFRGEALELGWINSAHGFGFVAGGFILSVWGGFRRRTTTALVGLVGVGVGMVVFGLMPAEAFGMALVVMFLRATMVPMIRGPVMAIFQAHVPPALQGRVFTLLISSISVMAPFGLAIGGPLADAWGARTLFLIGGIGCLVMACVWALSPTIMHMEDTVGHTPGERTK
jgi:DHA3 family macrolide efflux protein-like MFS transporter